MTKKILYTGLEVPAHLEGKVTHCPLIRIQPRSIHDLSVQQALSQFSFYTHIVITSKSTISILLDYLPIFGYGRGDWKQKVTIAIGQKTANELTRQGIPCELIAKEETSEGLVSELKRYSLPLSSFFFWPHSSLSRSVIRDFFQNSPYHWEECLLYDTYPYPPASRPNLQEFDEIIFTSPSTIDAFIQLFGSLPPNILLHPIGPITQHYLDIKLDNN